MITGLPAQFRKESLSITMFYISVKFNRNIILKIFLIISDNNKNRNIKFLSVTLTIGVTGQQATPGC